MGPVGYLVVGPESSGTKLTAALLRAAGCRSTAIIGGDDGPELPLDGRPPLVRRSLPHDYEWWSIEDLVALLDVDQIHAVVTTRDWFAMADSQVVRGLTPDTATSFANIRRAYGAIFTGLAAASLPFFLSSYEAMVSRPDYAPRLLEFLGLPRASLPTYDGNAKWFEWHAEGVDRETRMAEYDARNRGAGG